jgi:hypothetical protein
MISGGLFHIFHDEVVIIVLVAVVSPGLVVQRVLDELETGDVDGVEAQVVGRPGIVQGDGRSAEILERHEPLPEDIGGLVVALGEDTSDLTGAVVKVVVGGYLCLFGLQLHVEGISKMVPYIMEGAQKTLFFAVPEGDADGPFGLDAEGLEDADGFEGDDAAGAIIGSACPAVQESRWPPSMTTSAFRVGSVPGISATTLWP